jgi:23S rRNA (cytosine1962-C5)-methyltransferase
MPPALRLRRGRDRARVHPWIFRGELAEEPAAAPGAEVRVVDSGGRFVGRGFYNPRPSLCCRIASRRDEPLDAAFLRARLAEAIGRRRAADGALPDGARLAWSEGDGLPGLVVDRYGPVAVVQCLTLAMAERRSAIAAALREILGDVALFAADDATPAELEGFEPGRGWLGDPGPEQLVVEEGAVKLPVKFGRGHKTGLYLDQRENRLRIGALAAGRDVLDAFAYTAAFACHALAGGAARAVCLESSPEAAAQARETLALNGAGERATVIEANAFDELRRLDREGARFGLVVLDPPPFARSRHALDAAARGYKEINLRAMRLLAPGGRLATFTCSHHVTAELFEAVCRDAAADAGVVLRVLDTLGQAADHPVLLTVPETRYLKGLLLEAL